MLKSNWKNIWYANQYIFMKFQRKSSVFLFTDPHPPPESSSALTQLKWRTAIHTEHLYASSMKNNAMTNISNQTECSAHTQFGGLTLSSARGGHRFRFLSAVLVHTPAYFSSIPALLRQVVSVAVTFGAESRKDTLDLTSSLFLTLGLNTGLCVTHDIDYWAENTLQLFVFKWG